MDWMMYLKVFAVGGLLCVVGQLLISLTRLTPAKILVLFVTAGVILGALGIYQPLVEFAGAGATVPLTGFGNTLARGAIEAAKTDGVLGAFLGGTRFDADSGDYSGNRREHQRLAAVAEYLRAERAALGVCEIRDGRFHGRGAGSARRGD